MTLAFLQLRGKSHYELKKFHENYCDVARISLNTLSFIGPSAWTDIYGDRKSRASLPGDPLFYIEMLLDSKTIALASDVNVVPIRRAMNLAFSHRTLLEQEPMLQDHINHLVAQIGRTSREHGGVDMRNGSPALLLTLIVITPLGRTWDASREANITNGCSL